MPKKSSNNSNCNNGETCNGVSKGVTDRVFVDNVKDMKDVAVSYFTTDKLPGKVGDNVKLTLKEMIDKHLILPVSDKDGNSCDTNASYVVLTKLKDSYELKVNLKCGSDEGYVLVPLGCYSYCPTGVCENKDKKTPIDPVPVPPTPKPSGPSCSLTVSGKVGSNGWYTGDATVTFKSKTTTNGAKITSYGMGTSSTKNFNGVERYVVNKDGTVTVYGYVKDSNGSTAVCSINVKRDTVKPSCSLSVLSGSKGANGSYVSDVVLGFSSKIDATSGIANYGMSNVAIAVYNKISRYTINTDGTHKIYGYVIDNAGNTASCDLTVKREKPNTPVSKPACTLKVTKGTTGTNGWYVGNVEIGFASKTTTNGATITGYGLGLTETYAGNNTYVVNNDGTVTVYGYVKDSNGFTSSCSLTVKKDATKPSCSLKVTSGTPTSAGYYTTDVVVGFASKTDATSKIVSYGLSESTTASYSGNSSYKITSLGSHKVYGYVKDYAGNTAVCSITVEKKDNTEYQYKKDFYTQLSEWTNWETLTYNPSNPPKFGSYALIELVDLGKTTEIDYYKEELGEAFYKYEKLFVGTVKQTYCKDYDYYRETTTNTTYAVNKNAQWVADPQLYVLTGAPIDSLSVKWEFVKYDWKCIGCERVPRKVWRRYTRETYTATSTDTVNVTVKCTETEVKEVKLYDTYKVFVDYERIKTPVYKDVYKYKRRTREIIADAYTDYKWSYKDDQALLNAGYTYTGNTRKI